MLVDTLNNPLSFECIKECAPKVAAVEPGECLALGYWEEHCVECGAPACYARCEKYERALDGKCRRFENGVKRVRLADGSVGSALAFKTWGKLELHYQKAWMSASGDRLFKMCDTCFSGILRCLTKVLPFLPWNRNPIALYRALRNKGCGLWRNRVYAPYLWRGVCRAERDETLCCSVITSREEIFVQSLQLKRGWNTFEFLLPPIETDAYFRIFPPHGETQQLFFTQLEVVGRRQDGRSQPHPVANPLPLATTAAQYVKCVAWDLDNTLWRGILAEDGPEGVVLRKEVAEVIKALDQRGILHTLVSKNDFAPAWKQLEAFGLADYFIFPQINWQPKSANLAHAAKQINVGLDTFAFVDDSVYERGEVADKHPMVRIFDEKQVSQLLAMACFNPPTSSESASRRLSYLAEMKRQERQERLFDREAFLRDCDIRLTCLPLSTPELKRRCWELVQRTNQLTLAAHRYTEEAFETLLRAATCAYAIHCKDRFGEYGIVGFIALSVVSSKAEVTEFVMSCRVAKKLCEQSILLFVAQELARRNIETLYAEVVATGRNGALMEAFDAMPFEKMALDEKRSRYSLACCHVSMAEVFTNYVCLEESK